MSNLTLNIFVGIVGIIMGFFLGRYVKNEKIKNFYDGLNEIFRNLDNYVMVISALIVIVSIALSVTGQLEAFASITINVFGTIVFSWLLTKKSSKIEFKEHEQDLAMRAYRHINYLETSANTAYKALQEYSDDESIEKEVKLMLTNAMSQIKYIQGGINTCKMDWVDMLSPEHQSKYRNEGMGDIDDDYGTVDVVYPNIEVNQEDV